MSSSAKWLASAFVAISASPAYADSAAPDCSLTCASIYASPPADNLQAPNPATVKSVNDQLDQIAAGRAASSYFWGTSKFLLGGALEVIPYVGRGTDLVFDTLRDSDQASFSKQVQRIIDGDLANSILSGKDISGLTDKSSATAVVQGLIGPNSQFGSIASQRTDYDTLQDAAIDYLAQRIDQIDQLSRANLQSLRQQGLVARQQGQNLKDLHDQVLNLQSEQQDLQKTADGVNAAATGPADKAAIAVQSVAIDAYKIGATTRTIASQASAAATLLNNLGIPVPGLAKAAAIADIAGGLLMSGGNPLAVLPALAGLSGVLNGGGPDPMQAAILGQLQALRQQVADLQNEVLQFHKEEMAEHARTQLGIVGLLAAFQSDLNSKIQQCGNLVPQPVEYGFDPSVPVPDPQYAWDPADPRPAAPLTNARSLRPRTLAAVQAFYANHKADIDQCHNELGILFPTSNAPDEEFEISDVIQLVDTGKTDLPTTAKNADDKYNARYEASLAFLNWLSELAPIIQRGKSVVVGTTQANALMWAAAAPSENARSLMLKVNAINGAVTQQINSLPSDAQSGQRVNWFEEWVANKPIDVDLADRAASQMLLAAWWWEMYDANGLVTKAHVKPTNSVKPLEELRSANDLLRIAVSQQALLCGDVLLPLASMSFDGTMFDGVPGGLAPNEFLADTPDNRTWWTTSPAAFDNIVATNPIFAANLGQTFVQMHLGDGKLTAYRFAWARNTSDDALIAVLGPAPANGMPDARYIYENNIWNIERTSNGSKYLIPLPSPEDVITGTFVATDQLRVATELEMQLIREELPYEYALEKMPNKDDAYRVASWDMIYR